MNALFSPIRLAMLLFLTALSSCAAEERPSIDAAASAVLSPYGKDGAPALVFFISEPGSGDYSQSVGEANIELGVPASAETVFHIGSVTKQFTAAAILLLVEEGRLTLDDEAAKYLPDYASDLSGVTIRQLLNHTSGVRSYTSLAPQSAPLWTRTFRDDLSEKEMIDLFIKEPRDFAPGDGFIYSNSGYFLAGAIISRVSGLPYEEFLRQRIFAPLQLQSASLCRKTEIVSHRAAGYKRSGDAFRNNDVLSVSIPYAAGAICMNAKDLARWTRALHEGEVLTPESLKAMETPTRLNNGLEIPYGLGIFLDDFYGRRRIGHSGLFNGFTAVAWYYPENGAATVLLSNLESPERADDVVFLEGEILRRQLGVHEASFEPADPQPYVGRFRAGRSIREITVIDGGLQLDGAPLAQIGEDMFLAETGPAYRVQFLRDASGGVAAYLYMRGAVSYLAEACREDC